MSAPPKTLLVVNPKAARTRRVFPTLTGQLQAAEIPFEVHETTAPGDATAATCAALRAGCRTIVAVGGDGTISETAGGFFDVGGDIPRSVSAGATLAVIPSGTGNDFVRGLEGDRARPAQDWIELLIRHLRAERDGGAGPGIRSDPVDVIYGTTDGGACRFIVLNAATFGLGPEAARGVANQLRCLHILPGSVRFVMAACVALARWRERSVLVTIDDRPSLKCQSNLMAVANNRFAGGGMMLAPNAVIDDGKIDLLLACGLTRTMIARELGRIRTGGHLNNPCVSIFRTERVRIEAQTSDDALMVEADGNLRGHTPAEFRIIPGALRIIRPA